MLFVVTVPEVIFSFALDSTCKILNVELFFVYLLLAALGLHCCTGAVFNIAASGGTLPL